MCSRLLQMRCINSQTPKLFFTGAMSLRGYVNSSCGARLMQRQLRLAARNPSGFNSTTLARRGLSTPSAKTAGASNSVWRLVTAAFGLGFAGVAAYGAYIVYEQYKSEQERQAMEEKTPKVELPPEPEAYVHPYTSWPWYKRWTFLVTRASYLLYLWTPCALATLYMVFRRKTLDEEWMDWLLEKVVKTMELSGAGFQKFGQWVAMRPDLFPRQLCHAMARLHDDAPAHTFEHTKRVFRNAFGLELDDVFETFDPKPIASGTVGQVHKARLKKKYALTNGKLDVAVKVRHPRVLDASYADIWLIFWVMRSLPSLGLKICLPFKENEFYNNIQRQVDFTWEAYNLRKFAVNFRDEASIPGKVSVMFPIVQTELLHESVLVESWAPGENLSGMLRRKSERNKLWDEHLAPEFHEKISKPLTPEEKLLREELAMRCCDIAAKMFLRDNYIHGDLHSGNLLFSAKDNLLTIVDAGLTTFLEDKSFIPFGDFLRALCVGDAHVIVEKVVEFNVNNHFRESSIPEFRDEVSAIFDKYMGEDRSKQEESLVMGYIMGEVLNTIGKYSITLRGDVSSSLMTISISEGLILSLDPSFDLVGRTLPYFVRYAGWDSLNAIREAGYYSTAAKARKMVTGS